MIDSMYAGRFTKKSLRNYIVPGKVTTRANFVLARHIINGTDHADLVADYAVSLQAALAVGYTAPAPVAVVVNTPPKPAVQPAAHFSMLATISHIFGGK
jgi:hypothetical protein